jgi:two-component system, OmpR family, KDP operon response regulator KdpE
MGARVLVADDDVVVRDVVRRYLERDGMEVTVADDGNEALRLLSSRRIDVAVLDVMMPGPDGLALCRSLRQTSGFTMPVILLTALGEEDDRIAGLEAGADDYLTKPFGIGEMVARIRVALRRSAHDTDGTATSFRFGEVNVDLAARRVFRAGSEVHLTPNEYRLLTTLIRHAGKVCTHRQLLTEVWGPGHVERGHYVRIYMGQLRHKLEQDPTHPRFLRTEVGVGYRLLVE